MAVITMREALNQAMREEMHRDENVFLMGEEVAGYQGAYKISKGLLEEFGEKRVIDSPITELGFAGLGVGAAMVGLRPVIEFMTFNFSILATDQIINSAAKMRYMSGGQFKIPIVFRGPGGSAYQVSSQHSQALESWYANFPGIKVVMPSTPADAKGLLKSAIRDDDPIVFIEQERMYGNKGEVPEGEDVLVPIGVADVRREGTDATIVARSLMVPIALKAAEELAITRIFSRAARLQLVKASPDGSSLTLARCTILRRNLTSWASPMMSPAQFTACSSRRSCAKTERSEQSHFIPHAATPTLPSMFDCLNPSPTTLRAR